jgi:hypothetical protein
LIKLNDEILESNESIKECDIISNKLIRHLRSLNLTYSYNDETLYNRLRKVIDD